MTQTSINYATVLYELAIPESIINETKDIFNKTDKLFDSLVSPIVSMESKDKVIEKVFPGEMINFLKVLCHYHSMEYIYEIFDAYKEYSNEKNGVLPATLYYVDAPDDAQKEQLKEYLKKKFNKKSVEMTLVHKPELYGGFVIKANGVEIDNSVSGKIKQLQQKLVKR